MTTHARWFSWGSTLAVVTEDAAFSIGAHGWQPVSPADVTWDGRELSEADARRAFADDFEMFCEPPMALTTPT